jgi:hypothetical protein
MISAFALPGKALIDTVSTAHTSLVATMEHPPIGSLPARPPRRWRLLAEF